MDFRYYNGWWDELRFWRLLIWNVFILYEKDMSFGEVWGGKLWTALCSAICMLKS